MKLLVTGASGMLGHALMRLSSSRHETWGIYRSHRVSFPLARTFAADLTDEDAVRERLKVLKPAAIIHTAALTDVDECERNSELARRLNAEATRTLAELAGELGSRFVYISTDYVFDGQKGDYAEADSPNPVNVYGETKLMGEEAATGSCPGSLVIRTSIFGLNVQPKRGVVEYLIRSLKRGETVSRFSDQFATPIYTGHLSRLLLELLEKGAKGLFHLGGGEKLSRYEFALEVADLFGYSRKRIEPVPFRPIEGLARRPKDSSLCGSKAENLLGIKLPSVGEGLARLKMDLKELEAEL